MNTIQTTLITQAVFSDDGVKRYLLKKVWDEEKPSLAIIMLAPSGADGIQLDTTTQLVLNNASRLGYGRVSIVNLFATLNDFTLKYAEEEDGENLDAIVNVAQTADVVVYAPGTGKAKNKLFMEVQEQTLLALLPYEKKLYCLSDDKGGGRLQHPLSPKVRQWQLSSFSVSELVEIPEQKKAKGKATKKEKNAE